MNLGTKLRGHLRLLRFRPTKDLRVLLLVCVATMLSVSGCSGPTTNVQNQAPPPLTSVSITFQPSPPPSVSIGSSTSLSAVVNNDATSAGVDWALLCPVNVNCGKLSPLHSRSGEAVTYTPPSVISGNSQTFTIEGFATADHAQNVTAAITVTGFASTLKGTYVFATEGEDANSAFQLAGVIVLDGNGGLTSGEQTRSNFLGSLSDPISGGSYFVGPDGRGTLTINTSDQNIGQAGIENFSVVVLDHSRALVQTFDDLNLPTLSGEASSGTLELQTSAAAPAGGYAFVVAGIDAGTVPLGIGGVLNIDSPNAISGNGSVADENDASSGLVAASTISGTLTSPDALGSLKFNLMAGFAPSLQFTGYIVDATHIKLIESDLDGTGAGFGSTAGVAIAQGGATGTFTNNSAFSGTYVFSILGLDPSLVPSSLASLGQFTADSSGNLGNGYSPLVLDADSTSLGNGISVGKGTAFIQGSPPFSFNGPFGMSFVQSNGLSPENDATGRATVDANSNSLSGLIDINLSTTPSPNTQLTGAFLSPTSGRFTGTLTNSFFTAPNATISVAFYPVDAGNILFIETDFSVSAESTLGSFKTRTPLCASPACQ